MLRPGRKIWNVYKLDGIPNVIGPLDVLFVKKILPAGPLETGTNRLRSLVQVYTDPGGFRTLAVADIWSKDPGKADNPW